MFSLLANELALLADAAQARAANGLAFRLKLLLAAGNRAAARRPAPRAASPSTCAASRRAAGGVVCGACEAGSFPLGEEAYGSWSARSGGPLAQAPDASERALRQAERAIGETAEHHAHVRLRPLLARMNAWNTRHRASCAMAL